jgi:RNA recognition motif. (a.k.a. RRM, RBD, or RNP domain)
MQHHAPTGLLCKAVSVIPSRLPQRSTLDTAIFRLSIRQPCYIVLQSAVDRNDSFPRFAEIDSGAFVTFEDPRKAEEAYQKMNGRRLDVYTLNIRVGTIRHLCGECMHEGEREGQRAFNVSNMTPSFSCVP